MKTLGVLFLAGFGQAKAQVYDNGPINGTLEAWAIDNGYIASDSFTVSSKFDLHSVEAGIWDHPGDVGITSVDWSIGTTPFGAQISSGVATGIQNTLLNIPNSGFGGVWDIYDSTFGISGTVYAGTTYYLTLSNASVPDGAFVAWDVNNGPSMAYTPFFPSGTANSAILGSDSDSFKLYGSVPDDGFTLAMLATAMIGLSVIPRKLLACEKPRTI